MTYDFFVNDIKCYNIIYVSCNLGRSVRKYNYTEIHYIRVNYYSISNLSGNSISQEMHYNTRRIYIIRILFSLFSRLIN